MKNNFEVINNTEYDVNFYNEHWKQILKTVINTLKIKQEVEVTLNIVDSATSLKLNQTYRHKDYVADVLSFGFDQNNDELYEAINIKVLGDIFICWEKVLEQAQKYQHSVMREAAFLFLHGLLHLLGYDHQTKKEEDEMFGLQDEVLNSLKIFRTSRENEVGVV